MIKGKGKVYLIGAGPGDPGLITVRGLACLREADVVIYDYLANERLLDASREETERIYVGKKGGDHTLSQEQINALIVNKAKEGKVVARLKGGDPFIFGRGGEEAEELVAAGVSFEVIPGVTSAIAVPAYAGIPLTHRDFTSTVAFITGHEDPTKEDSKIVWDKIATGAGTLVFLMGMGNLEKITHELMANGRSPETPVAVIRWGTLPEQDTTLGKLSDIAAIAAAKKIRPPVIILVGEVVNLREKLNWFESLPLFGRKILVTRAREQASELSDRLRQLGAMVVETPTIEILPPQSWDDVDHCLGRMDGYDWIIFTSANGVKFLLQRLVQVGRDIRDLKGPKIWAIGPGTAQALQASKIRVDFIPLEYRAEAIIEGLGKENLNGKRILIPRARVARDVLPAALRRAGAEVEVLEVYRTVCPREKAAGALDLLRQKTLSAITFTSSSTVTNFVELMGREGAAELTQGVTIASIGPITAEKARKLGLVTTVMPCEYTIPSLVEALVEHFHKESNHREFRRLKSKKSNQSI
jgi:uroporphyrinogen III methyltransferase/synthase